MLTSCNQRNNHASSAPSAAARETDGVGVLNLLLAARTTNVHLSATGREQNDDTSLNDADQDQGQDFTIDHPAQDRHAAHLKVCSIVNSVLEMIEEDDDFLL
jgi:hypothetical protein